MTRQEAIKEMVNLIQRENKLEHADDTYEECWNQIVREFGCDDAAVIYYEALDSLD